MRFVGRGELAALAAGALLTLAFAPFGLYPLAALLAAALLLLLQRQSPGRAAWRGFLFGVGHFAGGVYWVYISLHTFGGAPLPFALLATALLVLYMALYPALFGFLLNRLTPAPGARRWLLAAPALWTLLEYLRSVALSGFPWLSIGYSQSDGPYAALAPLLGVFGVGWALWFSAGLLAMLLYPARGGAFGSAPVNVAAALLLLLSGAALSALQTLRWAVPDGEPLRVSLIQGNVDQRVKFLPGELDETLRRYADRSAEAAAGSDVIVWPETAIPVFYDQLGPAFIDALRARLAAASDDGVAPDLVTGIPAGDWRNGEYYNAVAAFTDDGAAFYHKRKLVPFGEYLPMRALFELFHRYVDIPLADFGRGADEQPLLRVDGRPVGASICFEAAFGNEIRRALPQASWLVNLSNDGWFGASLAPHQHLQMVRLRALETARPVARATNTGITALLDARGRVVAATEQFDTTAPRSDAAPAARGATLTGTLQPTGGVTPYVRYGELPALALALTALLAALVAPRLQPSVADAVQ